ncbi:hypothetical protein LTR94_032177, partial [Friedmanniomyces endolithicus]
DRFDADIEAPRFARGRHARFNQGKELVEDAVLERDRQREDAIEPALDRWHLVLEDTVLVGQFKAGAMLEIVECGAGELARSQQVEPGEKRGAGIFAFEVVGGIEQALPAGLALAARERPEAVETPCDRTGEAQLALAVGGHRAKQRRGGLMRAMGPA